MSETLIIVPRCWPLQWHHNEPGGVTNRRLCECLLSRLFRPRSKKTSKPRVTGLCEGNSPVTGEFPTQRASNAEHVSIWWRHHVCLDAVELISRTVCSTVRLQTLNMDHHCKWKNIIAISFHSDKMKTKCTINPFLCLTLVSWDFYINHSDHFW